MIKIVFILLLSLQASFSYSGEEVFEVDEIQEVIDETQALAHSAKTENPTDLLKELKRLGYDKLDISALKDPRVSEIVGKQFDESNISLMSLKNKRKIFAEHFKDSALKIYLDKAPKVRDVFIDVATDKASIMGFLAIVQREDRINILYVVLGSFILNLILRKIIINPDGNFIFKFIQRVTINLFCSLTMLAVIFFLFKKELTPAIKVISSHF